MDQALDETRRLRAASLRLSRAADERLIEAIFGDVLFGRLPTRDQDGDALAPADAAHAIAAQTVLPKAL